MGKREANGDGVVVDAVGWDYSMYEPDGVVGGMEAYVRRVVGMENSPMFIAKAPC